MNNKICFFTGHRQLPESETGLILESLEKHVLRLVLLGVKEFRTGGALGFDTLAALTVLKFKQFMPEVALHLYLPCTNQSKYWNGLDKKLYEEILQKADKIFYAETLYSDGCMQKRNRCLTKDSHYCICYLRKSTGGTAHTVSYANKSGVKIIRV